MPYLGQTTASAAPQFELQADNESEDELSTIVLQHMSSFGQLKTLKTSESEAHLQSDYLIESTQKTLNPGKVEQAIISDARTTKSRSHRQYQAPQLLNTTQQLRTPVPQAGAGQQKRDFGESLEKMESPKHLSIRVPQRNFPKSSFMRVCGRTQATEAYALSVFQGIHGVRNNMSYGGCVFTSIELTDFCIYYLPRKEGECGIPTFTNLADLYTKFVQRFYVDGNLSAGGKTFAVNGIPFDNISIGGFGDYSTATVGRKIWLGSNLGVENDIWYRLDEPETAYRRFYTPFLWSANLCKHVVDYLDCCTLHSHKARLRDFSEDFYSFVSERHGQDPDFTLWYGEYGRPDFRRAFAGNWKFLEAQANDMGLLNHPIWDEVRCKSLKCHAPPMLKDAEIPKTIVTPLVYSSFENSSFGSLLKKTNGTARSPHFKIWERVFDHVEEFTTRRSSAIGDKFSYREEPVKVGDVVVVRPDDDDVTNWKKNTAQAWFGYVHGIESINRNRRLKILWLDAPSDTAIANSPYCYDRELFLSDHCNCNESDFILEQDVLGFESITFFAKNPSEQQYFVRTASNRESHSFQTLDTGHFRCRCEGEPHTTYNAKDTVLVEDADHSLLEPCVLLEDASGHDTVKIHRFLRAQAMEPSASPNELILSDVVCSIKARRIIRQCFTRAFDTNDKIPLPYSAGGMGNFFYVRNLIKENQSIPLPKDLPFKQAFDPETEFSAPLQILELFCGCGNLGFGIEDSGVGKVSWAVDFDSTAIHTYNANITHSNCNACWISVDTFLEYALKGDWKNAPPLGSIDCIVAGSPCQGFSNMNKHKNSPRSLKNISMIASLLSYVDYYRPKYLILENVTSMAQADGSTGQAAFTHIVGLLVQMHYQVQTFHASACNEGAPQSRRRIFIVASAPGLSQIDAPGTSHRLSPESKEESLRRAPNDEKIAGLNVTAPRAFNYVSISAATSHLPVNFDGRSPSIRYPDHVPVDVSYRNLTLIENIPRCLHANAAAGLNSRTVQNFVRKGYENYLGDSEKGRKGSKSFGRMNPTSLSPCIVANFSIHDSRSGGVVHWDQNRPMTIEEARIAQQFPSDFVLLGSARERWKMVGNAVARGMARSLGYSLRRAIEVDMRKQQLSTRVERPLSTFRCEVPIRKRSCSNTSQHNGDTMAVGLQNRESTDMPKRTLLKRQRTLVTEDIMSNVGNMKRSEHAIPSASPLAPIGEKTVQQQPPRSDLTMAKHIASSYHNTYPSITRDQPYGDYQSRSNSSTNRTIDFNSTSTRRREIPYPEKSFVTETDDTKDQDSNDKIIDMESTKYWEQLAFSITIPSSR